MSKLLFFIALIVPLKVFSESKIKKVSVKKIAITKVSKSSTDSSLSECTIDKTESYIRCPDSTYVKASSTIESVIIERSPELSKNFIDLSECSKNNDNTQVVCPTAIFILAEAENEESRNDSVKDHGPDLKESDTNNDPKKASQH